MNVEKINPAPKDYRISLYPFSQNWMIEKKKYPETLIYLMIKTRKNPWVSRYDLPFDPHIKLLL